MPPAPTRGPWDRSPLDSLWVRVTHLDAATFSEAAALLAEEEPALGLILDEWGLPPFWQREPGFSTLVLLILEQQVSLESGAAMFRRLLDLVDVVTPETVLEAGDAGLRSIGVTRQKAGYLLGLAEAVSSRRARSGGTAPDRRVGRPGPSRRSQGNRAVDRRRLLCYPPSASPTSSRSGIAPSRSVPWRHSVSMRCPAPRSLETLSAPWRPVRAVAARLIWHRYLPPEVGSSHRTRSPVTWSTN